MLKEKRYHPSFLRTCKGHKKLFFSSLMCLLGDELCFHIEEIYRNIILIFLKL